MDKVCVDDRQWPRGDTIHRARPGAHARRLMARMGPWVAWHTRRAWPWVAAVVTGDVEAPCRCLRLTPTPIACQAKHLKSPPSPSLSTASSSSSSSLLAYSTPSSSSSSSAASSSSSSSADASRSPVYQKKSCFHHKLCNTPSPVQTYLNLQAPHAGMRPAAAGVCRHAARPRFRGPSMGMLHTRAAPDSSTRSPRFHSHSRIKGQY